MVRKQTLALLPALLSLLCLCAESSLSEEIALFEVSNASPIEARQTIAKGKAIGQWTVLGLDPNSLKKNPEVIRFTHENHDLVFFRRTSYQTKQGSFYWSGKSETNESMGFLLRDGRVFAYIDVDVGFYDLRPYKQNEYSLSLLEQEFLSKCGTEALLDHREQKELGEGSCDEGASIPSAAEPVSIDILLLYTPSAVALNSPSDPDDEDALRAHLELLVGQSNDILMDSGANVFLNLIHSEVAPDGRDDSQSTEDDLNWVSTNVSVASLRNQHGADIVGLIIGFASDYDGQAKLLNREQFWNSQGDVAFQVTELGPANIRYVLLHEIGHVMGLRHNPEDGPASEDAVFCFSFGHVDIENDFRTIMGIGAIPRPPRIPRLSDMDPLQSYEGAPLGDETRSNKDTINKTARFVSTFRVNNDNFEKRTSIDGLAGVVEGNNQFATAEPNEPHHGHPQMKPSIWWSWISPVSGEYRFEATSESFPVSLAIYQGNSISSLQELAAEYSASSQNATVSFYAEQGESFSVAVARPAAGGGGDISLQWQINELFADVDLSSDWFAPYLLYAVEHGLFEGFADGEFKPDRFVSRAELLKISYLGARREPLIEDDPGFPDVDPRNPDHWFWEYVFDAAARGYVSGKICEDLAWGFCPNESVTRYEAAKIIHAVFNDINYLVENGACNSGEAPAFPDVSDTDWYCLAVQWLDSSLVIWPNDTAATGPIVDGYSIPSKGNYFGGEEISNDGVLLAVNLINRAEAAKIIANAMNYFGTGGSHLPGLQVDGYSQKLKLDGSVSLGKNFEQLIDSSNPNAPNPVSLQGGDSQVVGSSFLFDLEPKDADDDLLFYRWTATGGSFTTSDPINFSSVTWHPPNVTEDTTFTVSVVRGDRRGKVGRGTFYFTVPADNGGGNSPASGSLTSPSGTQTGNVTLSASATDADGLHRVTATFVSGGQELKLCGPDASSSCSGTSGSFNRPDINPAAFGAAPGTVTARLFVEDDLGEVRQVDQRSFTYDPPGQGSGYTLTIRKQGDGDGTVSGDGVNCGPGCSVQTIQVPEGDQVTFSGAPDSASVFIGFAGDICYGASDCTLTMFRDIEVRASFGLPESLRVLLTTPADGDTNATTQPRFYFNREINPGPNYNGATLRDQNGEDIAFHLSISENISPPRRRLTFVTDEPLQRGYTYTAVAPIGVVEDDDGNINPAAHSVQWTIPDTDLPAMHVEAYPRHVVENDRIKLVVFFEEPVPRDLEISITSDRPDLVDHWSFVNIDEGEYFVEETIDVELTPGSTENEGLSLSVSAEGYGQKSVPIEIGNVTGAQPTEVRFLAAGVIDDDNGDGKLQAGERAEILFEVSNFDSTGHITILHFEILNTTSSYLRILGGSQTCTIGFLDPGEYGSCDKRISIDEELPTGFYYIQIEGKTPSGDRLFLDTKTLLVTNNTVPDYRMNIGAVTSSALEPGREIEVSFFPLNRSDGFSSEMVPFDVVLEVDGVEEVIHRNYAAAWGYLYTSPDVHLPIVYPDVPGEHRLWARINPPGPDRLPEPDYSNNESTIKFIRVAAPNVPPVLNPLGGPFALNAGETLSLTATASDDNNDPLTFTLGAGAPIGVTIGSTSGVVTWTPTCDQVGSHNVEVIVEDNDDAPDSETMTIVVGESADLRAELTTSDVGVAGTSQPWTLVVTNLGPSCADDVDIATTLSASLENVSWTCSASGTASCTASGTGEINESVDLLAGESVTYLISSDIAPAATGSISSSAAVSAAGDIDPNEANDTATAGVTLRDLDFGDAPNASQGASWGFLTALAEDGARHGIAPALYLGAMLDSELDGQPTLAADGDDLEALDDDDGVSLFGELTPCQPAAVDVTASSSGLLDAWVDFDTDGSWSAEEQVFVSEALGAGVNALSFDVPCTATPAALAFARFRFSSAGGLPSHGLALDGEVEDHGFLIAQVFHELTVAHDPLGDGQGTIVASPNGIQCGSDCKEAYPVGSVVTLSGQPALGSEFVGWDGSGCTGSGTCVLMMDAAKAVTGRFDLLNFTLSVVLDGTGSGSVLSNPSGISCESDCSESYPFGTVVTLLPTPDADSEFAGWEGAGCSGTASCEVMIDEAKSVTAIFVPREFALTLEFSGAGSGTVRSTDETLQCSDDCTVPFQADSEVRLSVTPEPGSELESWGGDCIVDGSDCLVTLGQDRTVSITLAEQSFDLTVERSGSGLGTVSSQPEGIDCGDDCDESYVYGTEVTLTAEPGAGSSFGGWSGGSGTCGVLASCTVTVEAALTLGALFDPACLDQLETGVENWLTAAGPNNGTGGNPWTLDTIGHSGQHSWYAADADVVSDQLLIGAFSTLARPGSLLRFWQRFDTEVGFDGGVLEYSLDGGESWFDILAGDGDAIPENPGRLLENGYSSTLSSCCSNPLPGRAAWTGSSDGWIETTVDLSDFAGYSVLFRWRFGTDEGTGSGTGWWVDDVAVLESWACPFGLMFFDGFESGGTTAWSVSFP